MSHTHEHPPLPAPSREGSVVLEIGGDLGALIIHTSAAEDGLEIEVSPIGADPIDAPEPRTHAAVRPRHLVGRSIHCVVISPLQEGDYTIWRTADTPEATVTVRGGEVTEHRWS
ncbi:hypothetical protein OG455_03450 [Kitasatospora sp. NBC_01287]|uniref:hypothetical protein n=1 Tax=Kitasatospora sp. NBC_01287 TaxID=2903573 RepID=UPI0022560E76|nr:hypothetical protein [Kitasatospora sp. NBC_01287]MCX4744585.1 hypothetical protein [Kitasatospora sp. NBC_01287]